MVVVTHKLKKDTKEKIQDLFNLLGLEYHFVEAEQAITIPRGSQVVVFGQQSLVVVEATTKDCRIISLPDVNQFWYDNTKRKLVWWTLLKLKRPELKGEIYTAEKDPLLKKLISRGLIPE